MRKITFLFLLLFIPFSLMANNRIKNMTKAEIIRNVNAQLHINAANFKVAKQANMATAASHASAMKRMKGFDASSGVIKTPKGTGRTYAMTSYVNDGWSVTKWLGDYCDTVYFDDKDVYFKDIVNLASDGSYIKGTIISGDSHNGTISIENGQKCAEDKYAFVATLNAEGYLQIDSAADAFFFKINNDTIYSDSIEATNGAMYILGVSESGDVQCWNVTYKYVPVDESKLTAIVAPAGIDTVTYKRYCESFQGTSTDKSMVQIGKVDNDFYFCDLFPGTNVSIKGTLNADGKIEFTLPEYVGKFDNEFVRLRIAEPVKSTDSDGNVSFTYTLLNSDKMYFSYDTKTGQFKSDDFIVFTAGVALYNYMYKPEFDKFNDVAVSVPATAVDTTYTRSEFFRPSTPTERQSTKISVARDGNDFYFRNICSYNDSIAFKGTLRGDTIYVNVPQYLGMWGGNYMYLNKADIEAINDDDMDLHVFYEAVNDTVATLRFAYDKASKTITSPFSLATNAFTNSVIDVALNMPIWKEFRDTVATVPADAIYEKYVRTTYGYDLSSKVNKMVRIAHKDNTYYLLDNDDADSAAVMVGVLNGNKLTFQLPQYVEDNSMCYLKKAHVGYVADENGDSVLSINMVDAKSIDFDYDETAQCFKFDDLIIWETMDSSMYNSLYKPCYKKFVPQPATPVNPSILAWSDDTYADNGTYMLMITIPNEDASGNYLLPDSMSYRIYFDDSVYTFEPSKYSDFIQATTDIPFNQNSSSCTIDPMDITGRYLWLYDKPETRVGLQTKFTYNGISNSSQIVYYNIAATGINSINSSSVKSELYYDLQGRRIESPKQGVFIHKITYTDGTSRMFKQVVK